MPRIQEIRVKTTDLSNVISDIIWKCSTFLMLRKALVVTLSFMTLPRASETNRLG